MIEKPDIFDQRDIIRLAQLLLDDAEDNPSLVKRSRRPTRHSPLHTVPPPKGLTRIAGTAAANFYGFIRSTRADHRDERLPLRSMRAMQPERGQRNSSVGRHLPAAGAVALVCLMLVANMASSPRTQPQSDSSKASKPDYYEVVLSRLPSAGATSDITTGSEPNPPRPAQSEEARLSDPTGEPVATAPPPPNGSPQRQDAQSHVQTASIPSPETREISGALRPRVAGIENRTPALGSGSSSIRHFPPVISPRHGSVTTPESASNAPAQPSIPRELLLARTALTGQNQSAARDLMEEAETLIVFQSGGATGRAFSAAASQITEALIMLGRGHQAEALEHLDAAITTVRPFSGPAYQTISSR